MNDERFSEVRHAHVVLAVCGGIAAYKACETLRSLQRHDCSVRVVMTADAEQFVGATTFQALSGHRVVDSLYSSDDPIPHISLASWADVVLLMPATANVLAKMAAGIADDALTTTLLAVPSTTPCVVAPAMNVHMWQAPATQKNVETLRQRGLQFVAPATGLLACGDVGEGKLATVDEIVEATMQALYAMPSCDGDTQREDGPQREDGTRLSSNTQLSDDIPHDDTQLTGRHVVVTAGPTHEAIDPVRYIANASSGKMGFAVAEACRLHGAEVTLIAGPCSLPTPEGVTRIDVVSAAQMHEATLSAFASCDAAICVAAVADYTPAHPADHKLKKGSDSLDAIKLVETADILADLSARKGSRIVVGFAAETDQLIPYAQAKLAHKGCDMIVANDVSRPDSSFGSDTNRVSLVTASGVEELPTMTKRQVADVIAVRLAALLGGVC